MAIDFTNTNPVSVGDATKKSHYDDVFENSQVLRWRGADITAAATITPDGQGIYYVVTGNTGITAISSLGGAGAAGLAPIVILKFSGTPLITHNATSLILPNGQNITACAGMVLTFVEESTGNWRCINAESPQPTIYATRATSSQSISAGAETGVIFNSASRNDGTMLNTTTGVITIAQPGKYLIVGTIAVSGGGTTVDSDYYVRLWKNGSTLRIGGEFAQPTTGALNFNFAFLETFAASNTVAIYFSNGDSVARNVNTNTWLSVTRLSGE